MARGGKAKRRIPSIPQVVTRGSIWQSATTSHGCQLQPCVKGGAFFRVFHFAASGIHQQKVFKLECTNNNKLDRWMLENLKFSKHPWSFSDSPVPCQLSATLGGLKWCSGWNTIQPIDSAAALFLLACFLQGALWVQFTISPTYLPHLHTPNFFFFFLETIHCVLNKLKLFSRKAPY